jgi:hypothetical protein
VALALPEFSSASRRPTGPSRNSDRIVPDGEAMNGEYICGFRIGSAEFPTKTLLQLQSRRGGCPHPSDPAWQALSGEHDSPCPDEGVRAYVANREQRSSLPSCTVVPFLVYAFALNRPRFAHTNGRYFANPSARRYRVHKR